jgi:hypothetical protein
MIDCYGFAVRVFVSQLWGKGKEKKLRDIPTANQIFELIQKLSSLLYMHRDVSDMHVKYKSEFSSLIFFILGHWIPIAVKDFNAECLADKLSQILHCLFEGLSVSEYPLGDPGSEFHYHIFASFVIIFQTLSKLSWNLTVHAEKITAIYRDIAPAVCESLYYLLERKENDESNLNILLAALFELTRSESGLPLILWEHTVEKYHIIRLFLDYFSKWSLFSNVNFSNVSEIQSSAPEQIVEILLCFSSQLSSAKRLYSHGVMALFCNNAMTPLLSTGVVDSYRDQKRSKIHRVWCLMVAVVSQLLHYLGNDVEFLEYSIGFSRLYHKQMFKSMDQIEHSISRGGDLIFI